MRNRTPVFPLETLSHPKTENAKNKLPIPRYEVNVPMTMPHRLSEMTATFADGDTILWTEHLSDCAVVVTWNQETCRRSLTHLPGGQISRQWADDLAANIDNNDIVITANGTAYFSEDSFRSMIFDNVRKEIKAAMDRRGKKLHPQFWSYFTKEAEPKQVGVRIDTFVVYANGVCGRAAPLNTAAGVKLNPAPIIYKDPANATTVRSGDNTPSNSRPGSSSGKKATATGGSPAPSSGKGKPVVGKK
ncbi:hypothetical protein QBC35DRAFT_244549 [Podospora australis]|uniref:Uncharacterized protein n=1 Tax=Podospora australis TaxID=1536484 RepID=A0AAN6X3K9_9PEZI|nr:hypothetical protein QBC35DRAFT_244549 [Podospora australis]